MLMDQRDGSRVAATLVHPAEETNIRLNNSASVQDAEMIALLMTLLNATSKKNRPSTQTHSYVSKY